MRYSKISGIFSLLLLILLSISGCNEHKEFAINSNSNYLTIATFNCEWLGDGVNDTKQRTAEDYENIAKIISETKADIIALQEIENSQALEIIKKYITDYKYFCSEKGEKQNLAFFYSPSVKISEITEYMPLEVELDRTRPGLMAYCKKGNLDLWLMNVHLKSTSQYDSTPELKQRSYELRAGQAEVLNLWIDSILTYKEKDIVILGDFNDNPKRISHPTLRALASNPNLNFATADFKSCKNHYWDAIDHIVISKNLEKRILSGSLMMFDTYNFYGKDMADRVSDHCPVMITLEATAPDDD